MNVASGPTDLYSALDDFFDPQEIETENKTVLRYGLILELPPILQINISRVMYDRERGAGYKIEHHLQFDEVIYLDRYTQTTAGLLERRKTSWEIKARLVQLRGRLDRLSSSKVGLDIPSVMDATSSLVRNFQEGNNGGWASDAGNAINVEQDRPLLDLPSVDTTTEQIDPSLPDTLAELARKLSEQVATIKEEMRELKSELAGLFTSYRDLPYRLHAVFIHRGTAVGGHYWVYICDYSQYRSSDQMDPADDSAMQTSIEGLWRCYNDSAVTPVLEPARTIFSHDVPTMVGVHRATPNLLVYVRDDIKERMIEAVCRQVDVEIAGQHLSANGGSYPRTTSPASLLMADGSASPIVHVPATEIMLGIDPERRQTPVTEILVGVDADSNPDYTVTTAPAEHLPFDDSIKLVRHEDGDGDDDEVDEVDEVREIRANTTSG